MTTEYDQGAHEYDHSAASPRAKAPPRHRLPVGQGAEQGPVPRAQFRITSGPARRGLRGRLYFDTERADGKGRTAFDRSMGRSTPWAAAATWRSIVDGDGAGVLDQGEVEDRRGARQRTATRREVHQPPNGGGVQLKAFDAPTEQDKRSFFAQMKARAQLPAGP